MNSANDAYQDFASQFIVFEARTCSSKLQQYPTSASRVDLHVLLSEHDKLHKFVWCYMKKFIPVMRMVIRNCLYILLSLGGCVFHNVGCLCPISDDLQKLLLTEYEWHSLCDSCVVYFSHETQMVWLQSSDNQIAGDICSPTEE